MAADQILRFGIVGTVALVALPLGLLLRYLFGFHVARSVADVRPPTRDERARIREVSDRGGLSDVEDVLVSGADERRAGIGGTPGSRWIVLSETALESLTDRELAGIAGHLAGKDETRLPELVTGVLVLLGVEFVALVGVDPPDGPLAVALVGVGLVLVVGGFAAIRRRTYRADAVAARCVGREPARAALHAVERRELPDWFPTAFRPIPSLGNRLARLAEPDT